MRGAKLTCVVIVSRVNIYELYAAHYNRLRIASPTQKPVVERAVASPALLPAQGVPCPSSLLTCLKVKLPQTETFIPTRCLDYWRYLFTHWASHVMLVIKNPPTNAGDIRDTISIPGSGRSPGGGHGNPLQHSCLENPMNRGAWGAMVHLVAKSQT